MLNLLAYKLKLPAPHCPKHCRPSEADGLEQREAVWGDTTKGEDARVDDSGVGGSPQFVDGEIRFVASLRYAVEDWTEEEVVDRGFSRSHLLNAVARTRDGQWQASQVIADGGLAAVEMDTADGKLAAQLMMVVEDNTWQTPRRQRD